MCPSVFWKMNWTIRESAGKIERRSMSCNCMTRTSQQECLGILEWQGAGLERSKSMAEEKKGFFRRLVDGLTKTRDNIVSSMDSIFNGFTALIAPA